MKRILVPLILLGFASYVYPAQISTYKWVDEKGVVNFTDDYNKVPPAYRDRVEVERRMEAPQVTTSPQVQAPPQPVEERSTDILGRGEVWWQERARPLKEKLKEATEKYENAHNKFIKKAEEVSQTNFYGRSRSQTKWDVMDMNRLREEEKKYEVQVTEAKEMLERLTKEAEGAKADPEWLK